MPRFINKPAHRALIALLRKVREEAGLTQVAVAGRLRGRQAWVSLIEVGQRRVDVVELLEVLQAIGVDPREFWDRYLTGLETPRKAVIRRSRRR